MTRSFLVERNGLRLHAQEEGNPNGPIVVFVHGYPDDKEIWDGVVELLKNSFRIVRYDVRGAGLSEAPPQQNDYRMGELVADLLAVVDAVEPNAEFHVVGHDWGSIQLWEAVSDPYASQRIRSFVSASGPALDHVALQAQNALREGTLRERLRVSSQALKSWYIAVFQLPMLAELAWSERMTPTVEKQIATLENIPFAAFHSAHRAKNGTHGVQLYRANVLERLRQPQTRTSRVPTHVLIPTGDKYVSEFVAKSSEPWAENVEYQRVKGGHWFYLRNPQIFSEAIRKHVQKHA